MQQDQLHIWEVIFHYLHKHNELAISGIGKFTAEINGVVINPVAKTIHPNNRTIHFHQHADETTPEFIAYFANYSNLTEGAIVNKLEQLAANFRTKLKSDLKWVIEPFGTFRLDIDNCIFWDSAKTENFCDSSFGLVPLNFMASLNKVKRIVVEKTTVVEEEELTLLRESALKELKVLLDHAQIAESTKPSRSNKVFPIVASVLTLALIINLTFFLFKSPDKQTVKGSDNQVSQMNLLGNAGEVLDSQYSLATKQNKKLTVEELASRQDNITSQIAFDSLNRHIGLAITKGTYYFDSSVYIKPVIEYLTPDPVLPEPEKIIVETQVEKQIKDIPLVENTYSSIDPEPIVQNLETGYYLIAAAFRKAKNSEKVRQDLITKGYQNSLVVKPPELKYNLVVYEKYNTLSEALLARDKTLEENEEVWIYQAKE